ncbi:MAG TPA: hypothetical protein VKG79_06940, partial [Bryobacteraceae bacterium]|nr:hypothetical protein [Bryobacteraceae bacterium]
WRVSPDLKAELEREARHRHMSLSALLDLAAQEWLQKTTVSDDSEEQRRLHLAAAAAVGTMATGRTRRSENTGPAVRRKLRRRYAR